MPAVDARERALKLLLDAKKSRNPLERASLRRISDRIRDQYGLEPIPSKEVDAYRAALTREQDLKDLEHLRRREQYYVEMGLGQKLWAKDQRRLDNLIAKYGA